MPSSGSPRPRPADPGQHHARTATAAGAPVQGPAAPSSWDLIWATGQTQAANQDPHSTRASREVAAAAEQAAFRAAQHIGLDDPDPDAYARELELEAPALEDGW